MAMVTDPIGDMLTRIRNGSLAEHEKVDIPASKLKVRIAELLKEEGFVKNFRLIEDKKQGILRVYLKYGPGQERVITGLRRVSKPGRRLYVGADKIPSVLGGMGVAVLSTPRGGLPDREARRQRGGGEVLCFVWGRAGDDGNVEDREEADRDSEGRAGLRQGRPRRGPGPQGEARAHGPPALLGAGGRRDPRRAPRRRPPDGQGDPRPDP